MKPTSLIEALQDADMLEIDSLYAWQFDLDTELLAQISAGSAGSDSAAKPLLQVHCNYHDFPESVRSGWAIDASMEQCQLAEGRLRSSLLCIHCRAAKSLFSAHTSVA